MRIQIFIFFILLTWEGFSQVGIGTTMPEATLDIRSSDQTAPSNTDGLLIPKIDVFPTINPTAQQQGMLVYLTTSVGSNNAGFYYWNNPTTTWVPFIANSTGYWNRDATGYLFPNATNDRVEVFNNSDATGTSGTGALEIANSLRLDGNEVITNTGTELFLQNGNNGDLSVDNSTVFVDASTDRVGIGTTSPTRSLHVNGTVRIVDGTQANGRVLTSNAVGVASWQEQSINNITGILSGTGIDIPSNTTANYLYTGAYIDLPPGRYAVNVTMLYSVYNVPTTNDSSLWLRSTFSNSPTVLTPSNYIEGSPLISGNIPGTTVNTMLIGSVIINNTTATSRRFYYVAGRTIPYNTTDTVRNFGNGEWGEDTIIAYRLN